MVFIVGWGLLNCCLLSPVSRFDLYLFVLLSSIAGMEFLFLTTFVLMNQKHQMRRTEQWANLHLQLSMLTEQEVTKNLQILNAISHHLRLRQAGQNLEVNEMIQATSVSALVDKIGMIRVLGQALADEVTDAGTVEVSTAKEGSTRTSVYEGSDDSMAPRNVP